MPPRTPSRSVVPRLGRLPAFSRSTRAVLSPLAAAAVLAAAALSAPGAAGAQVIRSYESLDRAAGEGFYFSVTAGFDGRFGNTETRDYNLAGAVGFRGEKHWVRLYPGFLRQEAAGQTADDQRSLHLRYSYFLAAPLQAFAFVQLQSDEPLDLESRFLVGGGVRRRLLALGGGSVDLAVGAMWEEERIEGGVREEGFRGSNILSVNGTAGTVDLTFTGFFQPLLRDWTDQRWATAGSAAVPLGSRWALDLAALWRRDTEAPEGVEPDDGRVTVGLRFAVN